MMYPLPGPIVIQQVLTLPFSQKHLTRTQLSLVQSIQIFQQKEGNTSTVHMLHEVLNLGRTLQDFINEAHIQESGTLNAEEDEPLRLG
jgi:hypothetical protein